MKTAVLSALLALLVPAAAHAQENGRHRPPRPVRLADEDGFRFEAGTISGFTTFDDEALFGSGVFIEFRYDAGDWFLFGQVRGMKFQEDPITMAGIALPLWYFGIAELRETELSTTSLLAGAGGRWRFGRIVDGLLRGGVGVQNYDAERTESSGVLGIDFTEVTFDVDGTGPMVSLQGDLAFHPAAWLDLEMGFALDFVYRAGFDLETRLDSFFGITFGATVKF